MAFAIKGILGAINVFFQVDCLKTIYNHPRLPKHALHIVWALDYVYCSWGDYEHGWIWQSAVGVIVSKASVTPDRVSTLCNI